MSNARRKKRNKRAETFISWPSGARRVYLYLLNLHNAIVRIVSMYPFYRQVTEAVQLQVALNYLPGFQACDEDSQGRNFSPGQIITWWRYHSVSSEF